MPMDGIKEFNSFESRMESLPPPPIQKTTQLAEIAKTMTHEVGRPDVSLGKEFDELEKETYTGIKTTLYKDPMTGIAYKIPTVFSPNPIATRIMNYLDNTGFCQLLSVGSSGSGKSTFTKSLVHRLHELGGFTPHWFERDDVQKIDTIIDGLEKGVNHIVVLDDASFSLEELPREKINYLAKRLTYIRHEVKADVIVIMNIHYSKAIKKFFRAVPFTFLTSINMEEVNSFQDVFGSYARYKLRDFAWYYQQMMVKKQWTIELDRWAGKVQTYYTNKPFRLALANEINHLHFFVYSKNSCALCDKDYNTKKIIDSKDFLDKMDGKYSRKNMRAILKTYALTRHGIPTWDTNRMAIWHTISELDRSNRLNWKEIVGILDENSVIKRRRAYIKKGSIEKTVAELEESLKDKKNDDQSTEDTMNDYKNQLESDLAEMSEKKIGDDTVTESDDVEFNEDKPIPNNGFGDDTPIDFGDGLNDFNNNDSTYDQSSEPNLE
jgi:hypothetical protein